MIEFIGYMTVLSFLLYFHMFTFSDGYDDVTYGRKMGVSILYILFPSYYFCFLFRYLGRSKALRKFFDFLNKDWVKK